MAELVKAQDLSSCRDICVGSSPTPHILSPLVVDILSPLVVDILSPLVVDILSPLVVDILSPWRSGSVSDFYSVGRGFNPHRRLLLAQKSAFIARQCVYRRLFLTIVRILLVLWCSWLSQRTLNPLTQVRILAGPNAFF